MAAKGTQLLPYRAASLSLAVVEVVEVDTLDLHRAGDAYTMDTAFCVEALQEALARFGRPEIFNTDQGSQFTSADFTDVLRGAQVRISMDGGAVVGLLGRLAGVAATRGAAAPVRREPVLSAEARTMERGEYYPAIVGAATGYGARSRSAVPPYLAETRSGSSWTRARWRRSCTGLRGRWEDRMDLKAALESISTPTVDACAFREVQDEGYGAANIQLVAEASGLSLEHVTAVAQQDAKGARTYRSPIYQVRVTDFRSMVHLEVNRLDKRPTRLWADLQRIKNLFLGPECEAVELFPAESRLTDVSNHYHLWGRRDPAFRFDLGFPSRRLVRR